MVVEDLPVNCRDFRSTLEFRTVESDGNSILIEQVCDCIGIPPIPPAQDLSV
jgi:hypothetical protein